MKAKFFNTLNLLSLTVIFSASIQVSTAERIAALPKKTEFQSLKLLKSANIPEKQIVNYKRYYNSRFNYSVKYPANILIPQTPPQNNDGRKFISPDESITMTVFGRNNSLDESIEDVYRSQLIRRSVDNSTRTYTYKMLGKDWFVVSGYHNEKVFYQKTILKNNDLATLIILYDHSLIPEFNPVVNEISRSFQVSEPVQNYR